MAPLPSPPPAVDEARAPDPDGVDDELAEFAFGLVASAFALKASNVLPVGGALTEKTIPEAQ